MTIAKVASLFWLEAEAAIVPAALSATTAPEILSGLTEVHVRVAVLLMNFLIRVAALNFSFVANFSHG